jgi:hypothetical protein
LAYYWCKVVHIDYLLLSRNVNPKTVSNMLGHAPIAGW